MRFQGFIGPSYTLSSVNVDCQRCINLFPETIESGRGKEGEVQSLVATPGMILKLTLAQTPVRGSYFSSDGALYAVGGNKIYKINSSFSATEIGTLSTSTGKVSFADNGTTLVFVDGTNGYISTLGSSTISQISDPDFKASTKVVFQDGYFIFNEAGTGRFFISEINSTNIDALDFASAEGNPDDIVSIISDHRDLWIFGDRTTEVFYNSGDADFPFVRKEGAFIEHGCAAAFSVAKMNNAVFWLSKDDYGQGIVYMASGAVPQRISTHPVEYAISGYSSISDANAFCYQQNGHFFYVLNFPSADTTWVYDMTTNLWHERSYLNEGIFERHRGEWYAFAYGKHIVCDYENGKIYELSTSTYTDAGSAISRRRVTPHGSSGLKNVFYYAFQLDMEVGVGLDGSGQGINPQAMLRFSDDGGHTWSNEKWVSFGRLGARLHRARWTKLGRARDRVWEITITDPNKIALIGAEFDAEVGAS